MADTDVLRAALTIEYPFSRTTGPVLGAFLTGLREQVLLGIRSSDGRVLVPPAEQDPLTNEPLTELVEVGPGATVKTWAWVAEPMRNHPLDRPFAFALLQPDGADTAMLHAVDAGSPDAMHTGMRVVPKWRDEREGHILDLECFVPEQISSPNQRFDDQLGGSPPKPGTEHLPLLAGGAGAVATEGGRQEPPPSGSPHPAGGLLAGVEPVRSVRIPAELNYSYTPGAAGSRFLRGLAEGKILGERCPVCGKVYVPPRGACPTDGVPTHDQVQLSNSGTVTSFCVVNVQFYGQAMEIPYVSALILLDGSDLPIMHLIQECPADSVHIGMRVEAVWVPPAEYGPTLESIKWFRPNDEADVEVHLPGETDA